MRTKTSSSQYSLPKIILIWILAAAPMAILGWIVAPFIARYINLEIGFVRIIALTVGLIWQFVLTLILVKKEEGDLKWTTIKRRLNLHTPESPKTGKRSRKFYLWVIFFIALSVFLTFLIRPILSDIWTKIFPIFKEPVQYSLDKFIEDPLNKASLIGAWWFLGLWILLSVFNTFLGEELLFRGILLPKMNGVFGKYDWLANGILFACYHWHQPWMILGSIVSSPFTLAFPAKKWKSTWMSIIIHSAEAVFFTILFLGLVLGFG